MLLLFHKKKRRRALFICVYRVLKCMCPKIMQREEREKGMEK
jgi:hypothetical protein